MMYVCACCVCADGSYTLDTDIPFPSPSPLSGPPPILLMMYVHFGCAGLVTDFLFLPPTSFPFPLLPTFPHPPHLSDDDDVCACFVCAGGAHYIQPSLQLGRFLAIGQGCGVV